MSVNHGLIWWSELMTRDVQAAKSYYHDVCGWSFDTMPMGENTYLVAIAHGNPVAGIMDVTGLDGMDNAQPHWFTYIAVDDIDAALEGTVATGGEVLRAPFDVPDVGRIGIVRDPSGAAVGLMTPVFPLDGQVDRDLQEEMVDMDAPTDDENFPI
ncbi:VOC family protein [Tropicimonas sp. IMCC34043]|uniref:VOC family protein n=1 Tax=Tropicimonas sp. IMCC34043 TaxID=2248760 RepID=UPI000E271DD2|nr:VOC family protein [Tropicimonas sp. IMCC34043]